MKTFKLYLAGPITGQNFEGATNWRKDVEKELITSNIVCYSPMRGKAYLSTEKQIKSAYDENTEYRGKTLSSAVAINIRDYNDVKTSDAILVNFIGSNRVSIGTVMEVAWARAMQIPIIIVIDKDNIHHHGMLTHNAIVVDNLKDGIAAVEQILNP